MRKDKYTIYENTNMNQTKIMRVNNEEFKKLNNQIDEPDLLPSSPITPPSSPKKKNKKQKKSNKDLLAEHLTQLSLEGRPVTQIFTGKEQPEERFIKKSKNDSLSRPNKKFGPDKKSRTNTFPNLYPQGYRNVSTFAQKVNAANDKWRQDKISHRRMAKYLIAEPQSLLGFDVNLPDIKNLTEFLTEQTKSLGDTDLVAELKEFKKTASLRLSSFAGSLDHMCVLNTLVSVYLYQIEKSPQNAVYLGFSLLWTYTQFSARFSSLIRDLVAKVMKWIGNLPNPMTPKPQTVAEPQIAVEDLGEFSIIFTTLMSVWSNMYLPVTKLPKAIIDSLSHFDRTKNSFSTIITFVITKIQLLCDWIAEKMSVTNPLVFITAKEEKYRKAIDEARSINALFLNNTLIYDEVTFRRVTNNYTDVEDLLLKIPRNEKSTQAMVDLLKQTDLIIKKVYNSFIERNFRSSGYRQEPVSAIFYGKPGIGKSNLVNSLSAAMVGSFLPPAQQEAFKKDSNQEVHNRQAENKFWDGYSGQFVTTFDDLGQMKDIAGNPDNEWMNVIRAVNSFEYNLHMAELSKKGNTYFTSKFVFATTNLAQFKPASIISVEAFTRRWDLNIEVELCDRYALPTRPGSKSPVSIDWKSARANGITTMHPSLLKFREKGTGEDWFLFDDLVQKLKELYIMKESWLRGNKDTINSFVDLYSPPVPEVAEAQSGIPFVPNFDGYTAFETAQAMRDTQVHWTIRKCYEYKSAVGESFLKVWNYFRDPSWDIAIAFFAFAGGMLLGKLVKVFIVPEVIKAWKYLSSLIFTTPGEPESELKQLVPKGTKQTVLKTRFAKQSGTEAGSFADTLLSKNSVEIFLQRPSGDKEYLGNALFIGGKNLLLPKHFLVQLLYEIRLPREEDDDENREISEADIKPDAYDYHVLVGPFDFTILDFLSGSLDDEDLGENDLALVYITAPIPLMRDVTSHFISLEQLSKMTRNENITIQRKTGDTTKIVHTRGATVNRVPVTDLAFGSYDIARGWQYKAATRKGDCGAVLLSSFQKTNRTMILGLHVAGIPSQELGIGGLVTQEDIKRCVASALELFGGQKPVSDQYIDTSAESQSSFLPTDSQVQYLGKSKIHHHLPTKTSIVPSLLHDPETATHAPALLAPRNGIDPFAKAIEKYVRRKTDVKPDDLERFDFAARYTVTSIFSDAVYHEIVKPLSFEDAVTGVSPYLKSITRSTSAGFPYNCTPSISVQKKKYFFGDGVEFDFSSKACRSLKAECLLQMDLLQRGITPDWIFVDSLKDERVTLEKLKEGKTRLFSVAPIELIIVSRMIFGNLMIHTIKNKIVNGFATGVNPYDPAQWGFIREHLASVSQSKKIVHVGAGDFSGFDASEHPELLNVIFKQLGQAYGPHHQRVIEAFGRSITSSVHLFKGEFFCWYGSMPSGHPLTTFINNILNISSFRFCFGHMCPNYIFDDHVRIIVQGDDNLWSVSQSCKDWFKEKLIVPYMARLGLNYTSDTKGDFSEHWRVIEDVQFLKRKFVKMVHPKLGPICIAPISQVTLRDMPMWKGHEILSQTMTILRLEWALHGRVEYNNNYLELFKAYQSAYSSLVVVDGTPWRWEEALEAVLKSEATW